MNRHLALVTALAAVSLVATGCTTVDDGRQSSAVAPPEASNDTPRVEHRIQDAIEQRVERSTVRVRNTTCIGVGTGSGFVLDGRSVVTNGHVVDGALDVTVNLWDGTSADADVLGTLRTADIAFTRLDTPMDSTLRTSTHRAHRGDEVTVVGFPGGGEYTLTKGEILDREQVAGVDMYRVNNQVRPGNSGGPLLNADGDVIGVVTLLDEQTNEGLAITIDEVARARRAGMQDVAPCSYEYLDQP